MEERASGKWRGIHPGIRKPEAINAQAGEVYFGILCDASKAKRQGREGREMMRW
jgi:hypothetical protein